MAGDIGTEDLTGKCGDLAVVQSLFAPFIDMVQLVRIGFLGPTDRFAFLLAPLDHLGRALNTRERADTMSYRRKNHSTTNRQGKGWA
ncbi:hypothetical protein [Halocatena salina]|uniref:Uncharacterized protein n=1 Tax=Halocatena salina TaxID=2934340 RepID=A0A8U0A743_9EURY|nr:hypothetical protein [Halocatena salina]UPM44824.1 hypothetical protein MW046_15655 [Halocatena salina]